MCVHSFLWVIIYIVIQSGTLREKEGLRKGRWGGEQERALRCGRETEYHKQSLYAGFVSMLPSSGHWADVHIYYNPVLSKMSHRPNILIVLEEILKKRQWWRA